MTDYSLLGSLYFKETPAALSQCLESLVRATATDNAEVVLVQDGPIGQGLVDVIDAYRTRLHIVDVILPRNAGLGPALNAGLQHCTHALIGRFDTDDLCSVDRFRRQLACFEVEPALALLGGWIAEFEDDPDKPHAERRTPTAHEDIVHLARKRNPFNHMTVMFRKQAVIEAGGYGDEHLFEDYALWVRMIQAGYKTGNVPAVLVQARAGAGMYRRRGGLKYAISEFELLRVFLRKKFITRSRFFSNLILRIPLRILPAKARGWIYKYPLRWRAALRA